MLLNNYLKIVRKRKNVSQLELSRKTGIAPANISCIENGKQFAYPGWRRRIAESLGVQENEIWPEQEVCKDANG